MPEEIVAPAVHVRPTVTELYEGLVAEGRLVGLSREEFASRVDRTAAAMLSNRGPSENTLKLASDLASDPAGFVTEALEKGGVSLSEFMEDRDRTSDPRDAMLGSDALSRVVGCLRTKDNGVPLRTTSNVMTGRKCHSLADLHDAVLGSREKVGRALLPELARRAYYAEDLFYASTLPMSPAMSPEFVASALTQKDPLRASILDQMVAITQNVPRGHFKYAAFTDQASEAHLRRVPEGAELPIVRLTVTDREARAFKYGVALETTYEAMRRLTIELWRFHLARIGQQNRLDKEQVGGEVLIAGDTNALTAATEYNIQADLGGSTAAVTLAPVLSLLGIMEEDGHPATMAIGTRAAIVKLLTGTTGSANYPMFVGPDRTLQTGQLAVPMIHPPVHHRSWVTANKILYIDTRTALGMLVETGGDITETDRYIRGQREIITVSEIVGFYVNDQKGSKLLDLAQ